MAPGKQEFTSAAPKRPLAYSWKLALVSVTGQRLASQLENRGPAQRGSQGELWPGAQRSVHEAPAPSPRPLPAPSRAFPGPLSR